MSARQFTNPFRPGAGHMPPYLAGREKEVDEFRKLIRQKIVLDNMVLTGLRGVGKTVLLDTFKPIAIKSGWVWVGTDLSEAASLTEERIAIRLLADMAAVTSSLVIGHEEIAGVGFAPESSRIEVRLDYETLVAHFQKTPGLVVDKLKSVLELVWTYLSHEGHRGIIFAYDEAQNLGDHSENGEFPLSVLLDTFQSIQKKEIPFFLVLVGLPTLFPKLVESRTFSERMFHVVFLDRLTKADSKDAILKPIEKAGCPHPLSNELVEMIVNESGGYPYFIQYICREVYDVALQKADRGEQLIVSIPDITRKLDADFFSGRWARATDRQRDLLRVISQLPNCDEEFTVQEVAEKSKDFLEKPFSPSHISQMLANLCAVGLAYKNRHGRYAFAVPLLGQFIRRQPV